MTNRSVLIARASSLLDKAECSEEEKLPVFVQLSIMSDEEVKDIIESAQPLQVGYPVNSNDLQLFVLRG